MFSYKIGFPLKYSTAQFLCTITIPSICFAIFYSFPSVLSEFQINHIHNKNGEIFNIYFVDKRFPYVQMIFLVIHLGRGFMS